MVLDMEHRLPEKVVYSSAINHTSADKERIVREVRAEIARVNNTSRVMRWDTESSLTFHLSDTSNTSGLKDLMITGDVRCIGLEQERDHTILYCARGLDPGTINGAMKQLYYSGYNIGKSEPSS